MVAYTPVAIGLSFLLASAPRHENGGGSGRKNRVSVPSSPPASAPSNSPRPARRRKSSTATNTGRGRYGSSGEKRQIENPRIEKQEQRMEEVPPPPLTKPGGPRPTYFTCRHTYEMTLINELERLLELDQWSVEKRLSTPLPGLVRLEPAAALVDDASATTATVTVATNPALLHQEQDFLDPVYALQVLPSCVIVSADSIKGLAQSIYGGLLDGQHFNNAQTKQQELRNSAKDDVDMGHQEQMMLDQGLRQAPRSSLAIHALVPGMLKGQTKPVMEQRSQKIVQELSDLLRKKYPAARRRTTKQQQTTTTTSHSDDGQYEEESSSAESQRWILQVLLLTPDVAAASLVPCRRVGNMVAEEESAAKDSLYYYWPNWNFPAGLAKVDITNQVMPSSAYRKLMEALECMQVRPHASSRVYDLGACPGGWTWVLRHLLNCSVTAIDKSELDPRLMSDPRIHFISGDAFAFEPPRSPSNEIIWMVSDIIAFPDRILELLERWCSGVWAHYMIVTMKFQGDEPDFLSIDQAMALAHRHGYHCRAKHFFNNKNEITLMLQKTTKKKDDGNDAVARRVLEPGVLGTTMYQAILPQ